MLARAGDTVFFKHPKHSWVLGSVTEITGSTFSCTSTDQKRGVVGDTVPKIAQQEAVTVMGNLVDEDVDDLLHLTVLHDASLLRCLFIRYQRDVIYTNIGAIVVAMNPFTFDIPWYKDDQMERYLEQGYRIDDDTLPHTWATAHNTYFELVNDKEPQFILVSGESGSGKTEASKIVVKYLAAISGKNGTRAEKDRCAQCGHKLSQCSPILEGFGNARTVRNDNSSRFGKFMKIQFSESNVLSGSHITRYLLEKSRIVTAAPGERVYHSFYLLAHSGGMAQSEFNLKEDSEYQSIGSGGILHNGDFDTAEDFQEVVDAMKIVGLSDNEVKAAWAVPAGILNLLNVDFEPHPEFDDASRVKGSADGIVEAASCWKVDGNQLHKELVETELKIRNETQLKRLTVAAARDVRDALCKALYDQLFGWLVSKCNEMCDSGETSGWIGLLDIFGFEDFEKNSFEQLCINLANETLQGHYNTYVFAKDMDECRAEGISTVNIRCPDNSPCLSLVSDPKQGIFALLDDQCKMGKGTDKGFLESVVHQHGTHSDFIKHKFSRELFGIRHYAGDVQYDVNGWLEKNRDNLKDGVKALLRSSTVPVIATLLPAPLSPEQKKRNVTVAGFFRQQLAELMSVINSSNPHWIRCIKPNPQKRPKLFDGVMTTSQLESSGVLGTVKIRKAGYPVRIPFAKFVDRFELLLPQQHKSMGKHVIIKDDQKARLCCEDVLIEAQLLKIEASQLGKTRVFLKADALTVLESKRRVEMDALAVRIQSLGRACQARKHMGRLVVEKAVREVVDSFRWFQQRTAHVRQERMKKMAMLRQQAIETSTILFSEVEALFVEEYEVWSREVSHALGNSLEMFEQLARSTIVHEQDRVFQTLRLSVGFEMVENEEESSRLRKEPDLLVSLYFAHVNFLEDTELFLTHLEKEHRTRVEEEWRDELQSSKAFQAMFRDEIATNERRGRAVILQQYAAVGNEYILRPFFQFRFQELMHSNFIGAPRDEVGSPAGKSMRESPHIVAKHHSERYNRWLLMQEEFEYRVHLKNFEKRVGWRSVLLITENEEFRSRQYLESTSEPRERVALADEFVAGYLALQTAHRLRILQDQECRVRQQFSDVIQAESWELLLSDAFRAGVRVQLQGIEADEYVFRRTIASTQQMDLRVLLYTNINNLPWNAEQLARLQGTESAWRTKMFDLEKRERQKMYLQIQDALMTPQERQEKLFRDPYMMMHSEYRQRHH